jgi:hypothetical protein
VKVWLREVWRWFWNWVEDTGIENYIIFLACIVLVVLGMTLSWIVNTVVS